MATRTAPDALDGLERPIALELALAVVLLAVLSVWGTAVGSYFLGMNPPVLDPAGVLVLSQVVLVTGVVLFAAGYVRVRDIDVGELLPASDDLALVALAVAVPVALVGLTEFVATLTGVDYNALTMVSVGENASAATFLALAGAGVLALSISLVIVCQVLLQRGFEQVVGADAAVLLTLGVAGLAMTSNTGGLTILPNRGRLLAAVLGALALVVALLGREAIDREWLQYLAYVPALTFLAVVLLAGVANVETVAGGLFEATNLFVLGFAAYAYERTDALLVPALAYASLLLANELVVFVFEAGLQSW